MGNKESRVSGRRKPQTEFEGFPGLGAYTSHINRKHWNRLKIGNPTRDNIHTFANRNTSGNEECKAMIENLTLLAASAFDEHKSHFISAPALDIRLDPCDVYPLYKTARFIVKGELRMDVAVFVTLWVQSSKFQVAYGETGLPVKPNNFRKDTKYIVKTALVAGAQFVGNAKGVEECMRYYNENHGIIASNHDIAFTYTVGHEITEPEFGEPGHGCKKGIHCFIDPESALAYRNTGFIDQHASTLISAPFTIPRVVDDEDLTAVTPKMVEEIDPFATTKLRTGDSTLRSKMIKDRFKNMKQLQNPAHPSKVPTEKIVRRIFGDWYWRHNLIEEEEKKIPVVVPPSKEHEFNKSIHKEPTLVPELNKDVCIPINPKLDPSVIEKDLPSAPLLEHTIPRGVRNGPYAQVIQTDELPEGSRLLLQAQELPLDFEPRRIEREPVPVPKPPQRMNTMSHLATLPAAPSHALAEQVEQEIEREYYELGDVVLLDK